MTKYQSNMTVQELQKKTDEQLDDILKELRETVRDMRFKLVTRQLKDVRALRKAKKSVARVLTIMTERSNKEKTDNKDTQ